MEDAGAALGEVEAHHVARRPGDVPGRVVVAVEPRLLCQGPQPGGGNPGEGGEEHAAAIDLPLGQDRVPLLVPGQDGAAVHGAEDGGQGEGVGVVLFQGVVQERLTFGGQGGGGRGGVPAVDLEGHSREFLQGFRGEAVPPDHVGPQGEEDRVAGHQDFLLDVGHLLGGELVGVLEEPELVFQGDLPDVRDDIVGEGHAAAGEFLVLVGEGEGVDAAAVGDVLHGVFGDDNGHGLGGIVQGGLGGGHRLFRLGEASRQLGQAGVLEDPALAEIVVAHGHAVGEAGRHLPDEDRLAFRQGQAAAQIPSRPAVQGADVAFRHEDLPRPPDGAVGHHEARRPSRAAVIVGGGGVEEVHVGGGEGLGDGPVAAVLRPAPPGDQVEVPVVCPREEFALGGLLHGAAEMDDGLRHHLGHAPVEIHDHLGAAGNPQEIRVAQVHSPAGHGEGLPVVQDFLVGGEGGAPGQVRLGHVPVFPLGEADEGLPEAEAVVHEFPVPLAAPVHPFPGDAGTGKEGHHPLSVGHGADVLHNLPEDAVSEGQPLGGGQGGGDLLCFTVVAHRMAAVRRFHQGAGVLLEMGEHGGMAHGVQARDDDQVDLGVSQQGGGADVVQVGEDGVSVLVQGEAEVEPEPGDAVVGGVLDFPVVVVSLLHVDEILGEGGPFLSVDEELWDALGVHQPGGGEEVLACLGGGGDDQGAVAFQGDGDLVDGGHGLVGAGGEEFQMDGRHLQGQGILPFQRLCGDEGVDGQEVMDAVLQAEAEVAALPHGSLSLEFQDGCGGPGAAFGQAPGEVQAG